MFCTIMIPVRLHMITSNLINGTFYLHLPILDAFTFRESFPVSYLQILPGHSQSGDPYLYLALLIAMFFEGQPVRRRTLLADGVMLQRK
jgi:hypothetical protein